MILLLSQNEREITTEQVMDWLHAHSADYRRINGIDLIQNQITVQVSSKKKKNTLSIFNFNCNDNIVIWNRRLLSHRDIDAYTDKLDGTSFTNFKIFLLREFSRLKEHIFDKNKFLNWVDFPDSTNFEKLDQLTKAEGLGINIPETIISNELDFIKEFIKKHGKVITKPIANVTSILMDGFWFYSLQTKLVTLDQLEKEGNKTEFSPSLFQRYIDKKYEIRSFYLDGKFYSMAMFSQLREMSKVDFRNYDQKKPVPRVPYQLPSDLEDKLKTLISRQGLTNCSIDIVVGENGKHYFLEINPVGQFGMVSGPCNYHLEKKVASFLINKYKLLHEKSNLAKGAEERP